MLRRPLCPPAPPPALSCSRPKGRSSSSWTTSTSAGLDLEEARAGGERAAGEVHEGLRLRAGGSSPRRRCPARTGPRTWPASHRRARASASASTTRKPTLWRWRSYSRPGLPSPQMSFTRRISSRARRVRGTENADGAGRRARRPATDPAAPPGTGRGLRTTSCRPWPEPPPAAAAAPLAGAAAGARRRRRRGLDALGHRDHGDGVVHLGLDAHARGELQVVDVHHVRDLHVGDVRLDALRDRLGEGVDLEVAAQLGEDAAVGHALRLAHQHQGHVDLDLLGLAHVR